MWMTRQWVVVCLLLFSGMAVAEPEDTEGEQLRALRGQILEARERVGEHEREEREVFGRLEDLDRKIDDLKAKVNRAQRDAEKARAALQKTVEHEAIVSTQLKETRAAMSRRVVGLYKTGEIGPLRVLFSSTSLPELLSRASLLRKLLEHDTDLVTRFRSEVALVEKARAEAARQTVVRDEASERIARRSAEVTSERLSKKTLLARVRSDRATERAVLVELERAARALEEKLVALGEGSRSAASQLDAARFVEHKGSLRRPVRGAISSGYGVTVDAEYLTETFNKGVEFEVDLGDSVKAVAFGEVRFAGWFRGYGKIVILDHGNQYFTVSGHLEDIYVEVGQSVDEGDTVATTGDTGSLTGPSFYFEVRQGGAPLNPEEWFE
jgi:septal ring factor EnvC (AmiA/AmiB activator)